jgi:hypothetical protein
MALMAVTRGEDLFPGAQGMDREGANVSTCPVTSIVVNTLSTLTLGPHHRKGPSAVPCRGGDSPELCSHSHGHELW